MTREEQIDKIIDEVEKEFEKVNIPIMDKLTLFSKVQNALYKCGDLVQEPKMGRWNKSMDDYSYFYTCSCCGERIAKNGFGDDLFSPYCPECGANMQEVEK